MKRHHIRPLATLTAVLCASIVSTEASAQQTSEILGEAFDGGSFSDTWGNPDIRARLAAGVNVSTQHRRVEEHRENGLVYRVFDRVADVTHGQAYVDAGLSGKLLGEEVTIASASASAISREERGTKAFEYRDGTSETLSYTEQYRQLGASLSVAGSVIVGASGDAIDQEWSEEQTFVKKSKWIYSLVVPVRTTLAARGTVSLSVDGRVDGGEMSFEATPQVVSTVTASAKVDAWLASAGVSGTLTLAAISVPGRVSLTDTSAEGALPWSRARCNVDVAVRVWDVLAGSIRVWAEAFGARASTELGSWNGWDLGRFGLFSRVGDLAF